MLRPHFFVFFLSVCAALRAAASAVLCFASAAAFSLASFSAFACSLLREEYNKACTVYDRARTT